MSVNAAFSIFKPNPLYRNLSRDDAAASNNSNTHPTNSSNNSTYTASHHGDDQSTDGKMSVLSEDVDELDDISSVGGLRDVDDTLEDQVRELEHDKAELERRNVELRREKAELLRQRAADSELATLVSEMAAQKKELQTQNQELVRRNRELVEQQEQESTKEVSAALAGEWAAEKERLEAQNDELRRLKDELQQRYDELLTQPRVDEELATLVDGLATRKDDLEKQNKELETEVDELYDLMEQMSEHVESLEAHQHSMVAYVNKVCNDVKNVKRRGVWQKIEFDKERQQIVEELYSWKRRAEELKAAENDAVSAAEATAAWEAACLNQTIEQLQGEVLTLRTELDETKEELSRRGGSAEEIAETEQMLEAVQELALELKAQVDEANAALEKQKSAAQTEIDALQQTIRDMKQRTIKESVAHDKERQELVEELLVWKNRVLEAQESNQLDADAAATSSTVTEEDQASETDQVQVETGEVLVPVVEEEETEEMPTDNQLEHQSETQDANKTERVEEEAPSSTASESSHLQDDADSSDNQKAHDDSLGEEKSGSSESRVISTSHPALEDDGDDVYNEGDDDITESPLEAPLRSESFFSRLRSFSWISQTDSVPVEPESTTPARSRANSTASSTTSTASSTTRAKAKKSPPVTQNTQGDYLRKQEPYRMNSFKHFL